MKKTLLAITIITLSHFTLQAQNPIAPCSDLFISEYVEGTNNNKALELYNPTLSPISLAEYRIIRWDNGNVYVDPFPAENVLNLPANITLQPNTTYVIALNLTDPTGTGQSAPIDVALQAVADTLLCPGCATGTGESRVMCFNGDDALSLQKLKSGTWVDIDIFACIGERPSNSAGGYSPTAGWTILPPYSAMPTNYDASTQGPYFFQYWTQDKTLKRKFSVKAGVNTNPSPQTFNASVQWDSLPQNTYTGLGSHSCECYPQNISNNYINSRTQVYPNPSSGIITVNTRQFSGFVVLTNIAAQTVKSIEISSLTDFFSMDISDLPKGAYTLTLLSNQKSTATPLVHKKVILQ